MDAVKFLQERARMCNSFSPDCEGCRMDEEKPAISECYRWMLENPKRAVEIVEEWSTAHPLKTRQSLFIQQYPKVATYKGVIGIRPCQIEEGYTSQYCLYDSSQCVQCRKEYWLQEVE